MTAQAPAAPVLRVAAAGCQALLCFPTLSALAVQIYLSSSVTGILPTFQALHGAVLTQYNSQRRNVDADWKNEW